MSDEGIRYEINHEGKIVRGTAALSDKLDDLVKELFTQFGWIYNEQSKHSTYRSATIVNPNGEEFKLDLFTANIRNEKRSSYEKKIQLSKEDPRLYKDNITIILGFYVFDVSDGIKDAIIVGYPVDNSIKYNTNPSLRGTFVNDILFKSKINGICIDKERKMVGFRPEFIYYYLNSYKRLHEYEGYEAVSVDENIYTKIKLIEAVNYAHNRIVFGAPGTGKSHRLDCDSSAFKNNLERVTFHPNYSYSQFVGTYKPVQGEKETEIKYEYIPGPFMRIYSESIKHPENNYLLLIEEINRSNIAAVFGDVFQLLDRKNGVSEYKIATSEDVRKFLLKELCSGKSLDECDEQEREKCMFMSLPSNMYIWATMNSADQGVFPMDTAFKRRWEFEYIGVDDEKQIEVIKDYYIPMCVKDTYYVKWQELRNNINTILSSDECKVNEDKLLGPFFISKNVLDEILFTKHTKDNILNGTDKESDLSEVEQKEKAFIKSFESKVLMYLFDDVMKMRPKNIFVGHERNHGKMIFSKICEAFEANGENIFGFSLQEKVDEV